MSDERPHDIRQRAFQYSLRAIRLYQALQEIRDGAGWIIGKQYLRAATSIGANLEEAQAGETRADFVHKCGIAEKEIRESIYWLRPLHEAKLLPVKRLMPLEIGTKELYAVITAIIRNTKARTSAKR
jgi:four helix bundle protein